MLEFHPTPAVYLCCPLSREMHFSGAEATQQITYLLMLIPVSCYSTGTQLAEYETEVWH